MGAHPPDHAGAVIMLSPEALARPLHITFTPFGTLSSINVNIGVPTYRVHAQIWSWKLPAEHALSNVRRLQLATPTEDSVRRAFHSGSQARANESPTDCSGSSDVQADSACMRDAHTTGVHAAQTCDLRSVRCERDAAMASDARKADGVHAYAHTKTSGFQVPIKHSAESHTDSTHADSADVPLLLENLPAAREMAEHGCRHHVCMLQLWLDASLMDTWPCNSTCRHESTTSATANGHTRFQCTLACEMPSDFSGVPAGLHTLSAQLVDARGVPIAPAARVNFLVERMHDRADDARARGKNGDDHVHMADVNVDAFGEASVKNHVPKKPRETDGDSSYHEGAASNKEWDACLGNYVRMMDSLKRDACNVCAAAEGRERMHAVIYR
jgi:hypothetical protein